MSGEIENNQVAPDVKEEKEEYSIFSDPAEKPKEKEKISKHPLRNRILAAVVAAAVIAGGTFAVIKFVPKPEEETEEKSEISVLNVTEPINSMKLNNEITSLEFVSQTVQGETESELLWTISGVKSEYTNSSSIEKLVNSVATMNALQKIPLNKDEDYGFANSKVNAELKTNNSDITVTFGKTAPADVGVYCKTSTDDNNVYIVNLVAVTALQVIPTDFADAKGYGGIEITSANTGCFSDDGTVTEFDYIELNNKNYSKPLKIVAQNDESVNAYFAFKVVSPMERIGNNENSQAILNLFAKGFSAEGAYAFDPNDTVLQRYHLKNPDVVCTVSINKKEYTLKFGIIDETYCAYLSENGGMIEKVPIASIPFISNSVTDYYSSFIVLENLSGLKALKIKTADVSYDFDLQYTAGKETKDDVYKAFISGKELDIKSFKNYYQELIGMSPIAYDTGAVGTTDMSITFVHSDDLPDTVLTFRKFSSQRYQVDINGLPLGIVTKTLYDTFLSNTAKIAAGEKM